MRMLADQVQGSVKPPKQPGLAGQAQSSRRTKKSSKSFGDIRDNLKKYPRPRRRARNLAKEGKNTRKRILNRYN